MASVDGFYICSSQEFQALIDSFILFQWCLVQHQSVCNRQSWQCAQRPKGSFPRLILSQNVGAKSTKERVLEGQVSNNPTLKHKPTLGHSDHC